MIGQTIVGTITAEENINGVLSIGKAEPLPIADTLSAYFDDSVETISSNAERVAYDYSFYKSNSIQSVDMPNCTQVENEFLSYSTVKNVNLPKVEKIGSGFLRNTSITSFSNSGIINLESYKAVGSYVYALDNCASLETLNLENATYIGRHSLYNCTSLKNINLPNVTRIADYCFYKSNIISLDDNALPNIEVLGLPQGSTPSTSLGSVFSTCTSLTSVNLPTLKEIYRGFFNCTALEEFVAPNVETLYYDCFGGTKLLKVLKLPKLKEWGNFSISTASTYNFGKLDLGLISNLPNTNYQYLANLTALVLRKNDDICTYSVTSSTRDFYNKSLKIYVPRALVDTYKTATNWSRLADKFVALEDYTVDGTTTGEFVG